MTLVGKSGRDRDFRQRKLGLAKHALRVMAGLELAGEQVLDVLKKYGSIQYAHDEAAVHAAKARSAICTFPDTEIKRALLMIPDFVVERNS